MIPFSLQKECLKKLLLIFSTIYYPINAQTRVLKDTVHKQLAEIIVAGIIPNKKLNATAENIQIVTKDQLQINDGLNYSAIINQVPGVFMQSATLSTNRITIRGIGARSPFGTTSIRAYFGEIPLTDGNGISTIENLELGAISGIEIHKGPAASSFGVGLGGTIILKPDYAKFNSGQMSLESTHGSYGLLKNLATINMGFNKTTTNFVYSNTLTEGYRDNNNYNRETLTNTTLLKISSKDELQFLGNYTDLKAFIPSSLDLETYNTSPKSAAFTWAASQGFEDTQSALIGLSWEHSFNTKTKLYSSTFATNKENYEPRPFNILQEKAHGLGIRSRLTGILNNNLKWGFGGELFYDELENHIYANLYEDFPLGIGSVQGETESNYTEFRNYSNLFAEINFQPYKKLLFSAGLNLNQTHYKIKDHFNPNAESTSGNYNFNAILSPKMGVVYNLNTMLQLKGSIAHGFAPPTTEETLLPDGDINTNLKPEQGWNFEFSANYKLLKNRLYGNLNFYLLSVKDLLVNRRAENEALFAINAGKTNHFGIEGSINAEVFKTTNLRLIGFSNFSIYQYYFEDFIDDGIEFSGNKLTGVPSGVCNAGIIVKSKFGISGNINYQYVGRMPANDQNSVFSDNYQLLNAKINYKIALQKKLNFKVFVGINNILDTKYVSQLQVNASGFGGSAPRYFYPGNPINFYGGAQLSYSFL